MIVRVPSSGQMPGREVAGFPEECASTHTGSSWAFCRAGAGSPTLAAKCGAPRSTHPRWRFPYPFRRLFTPIDV